MTGADDLVGVVMGMIRSPRDGAIGVHVKVKRPGVAELYAATGSLMCQETGELLCTVAVSGNVAAVAAPARPVILCWGEDQLRALLGVLCD